MNFRFQDNSDDNNSDNSHTDHKWNPPIEFIDLSALSCFEVILEKDMDSLDS